MNSSTMHGKFVHEYAATVAVRPHAFRAEDLTPNRTCLEPMSQLRNIRLAVMVAVTVSATILSSCGADVHTVTIVPPTTTRPNVPTVKVPMTTTTLSTVRGAQAAQAAINAAIKYAAAARPAIRPSQTAPARVAIGTAARTSGINWDCVAMAETGGDWTMHGSNYSTALGILNQAVRENADAATAARIVAGQGTRAEQIAVADSIIHKFGFRAWAPSTVAKCS